MTTYTEYSHETVRSEDNSHVGKGFLNPPIILGQHFKRLCNNSVTRLGSFFEISCRQIYLQKKPIYLLTFWAILTNITFKLHAVETFGLLLDNVGYSLCQDPDKLTINHISALFIGCLGAEWSVLV